MPPGNGENPQESASPSEDRTEHLGPRSGDGTAADAEPIAIVRVPLNIRNAALTTIAVIGSIFTLQYLREVIIPIVLSGLIFYALDPVVDRVERFMPRVLATLLVLGIAVSTTGVGIYALRYQAFAIVDQLPDAAQRFRRTLRESVQRQAPLEKVKEAATELERAAAEATDVAEGAAPQGVTRVQIEEPALRVSDYLWWGWSGGIALAGDLVMILFLTFFLLVSNDLYKRKLVKMVPSYRKKRITVQIVDQISRQIERFLLVQVFTSLLVGVVTWLVLSWLGLEQAAVWGLASGLFNSIPYFGPVIVSSGLALVAYIQFDTISMAIYVAAIAMAITSLEGFLLTPTLMGRAGQMNPAAVFVGLIFWSWIWGVWGLLLAVPMMMMVKAIADHIEGLHWVAELLGE